MSGSYSQEVPSAFTPATRSAFARYLSENPNNRRVSLAERENIIEWLTNPLRKPTTQKEFSRRNYVRNHFQWDQHSQRLMALGRREDEGSRIVVTEDQILEVVEQVHRDIGHAGWDATWKTLSAHYYGILRSDIIFLLRRCQICAQNPAKRPKGAHASAAGTYAIEGEQGESSSVVNPMQQMGYEDRGANPAPAYAQEAFLPPPQIPGLEPSQREWSEHHAWAYTEEEESEPQAESSRQAASRDVKRPNDPGYGQHMP
ncbi:hypothetical protein BDY21DRAFT_368221 [Lineolata rhizophorae]|uniref:Integrase zinc-binding domain-containing protein n=1 Tax=Lineolata rhizophorae TaxID=578093 RepID=A0A6A6PDN7_9PEZI|nr:hypothetical protein BDY21DRAFT_368221 [Lineolata rhizophorae]